MAKVNSEILTGIALCFLASLFVYAASVNKVWALILPADYLILAIGIAFIVLGLWDTRKYAKGKMQRY
jgi:putative Ca2+/H+ antiporter (TMEM165/GDT1 family)